jgi:6-pyruvoyltetrahydropterin/6-carboxytetrahydropterin synthase
MKTAYQSTKVIELGSCAFRQWRATHSHCKYIHGYQLKAKLWFGGSSLDDKNWLVDFGGLKDLKAKLQGVFDHTMTVAADDPELETFKDLDRKGIIQLRVMEAGVGIERAAETVFNITQQYIHALTLGRCWVDKVEVFEHEDNSATFSKETFNEPVFTLNTSESVVQEPTDIVQDITENTPEVQVDRGARVGGNVSSGKGNWFAGTTWG